MSCGSGDTLALTSRSVGGAICGGTAPRSANAILLPARHGVNITQPTPRDTATRQTQCGIRQSRAKGDMCTLSPSTVSSRMNYKSILLAATCHCKAQVLSHFLIVTSASHCSSASPERPGSLPRAYRRYGQSRVDVASCPGTFPLDTTQTTHTRLNHTPSVCQSLHKNSTYTLSPSPKSTALNPLRQNGVLHG